MKTHGEIEAAACKGHFEQGYMGRVPKDNHTHLIEVLPVVRLQVVLTAAEWQLVKTRFPERGRDLLRQVRTQIIGSAGSGLETLIQEIIESNPIISQRSHWSSPL